MIIVGRWLENALMWTGVVFTFRKGKCLFVARLKVTSKKSVSIRFVLMVIESPSSLTTHDNNNEKRPVYALLKHTQRLTNKKVNE